MKAEEIILKRHKVKKEVRYLFKLCSALTTEEIELAIARLADLRSQSNSDHQRKALENLGSLIVRYRRLRIKRAVKVRTIKRISLWHSAGDMTILNYAVSVMCSLDLLDDALGLLEPDEVDLLANDNGR